MTATPFYVGSIMILAWGIAHFIPTRSVVNGFGSISRDNRRIITMEWVAVGIAMVFIGVLNLVITASGQFLDPVALIVYRTSGIVLIALTVLSKLTGARTAIVPMKICPYVQMATGILFLVGSSG
jgi:uncharacterized membrane protein YiaA